MKVSEFAADLGVPVAKVKKISGKQKDNAMLSVEEQEHVAAVLNQEAGSMAGPEQELNPAREGKPTDVVRFWSEVMKHSFEVFDPAKNAKVLVKFENYRLAVVKDSGVYKALVALDDSLIRVIVDKPFEDLGERSSFREMLEKKLYTGPRKEPSIFRGLAFVQALFRAEEVDDVAKQFQTNGTKGLLELAVSTKSFLPIAIFAKK